MGWDTHSLIIESKKNKEKVWGMKLKRSSWCTMHLFTTHWWMSSPSLSSDHQFPANSPSLYPGHDILWCGISLLPYLQVSCPGSAPSHLVHLCWQGMETWKIPECKHYLAKNKTSLCYQHIFTLNSKLSTVPGTKRKLTLSQSKPGYDPGGSRLDRLEFWWKW